MTSYKDRGGTWIMPMAQQDSTMTEEEWLTNLLDNKQMAQNSQKLPNDKSSISNMSNSLIDKISKLNDLNSSNNANSNNTNGSATNNGQIFNSLFNDYESSESLFNNYNSQVSSSVSSSLSNSMVNSPIIKSELVNDNDVMFSLDSAATSVANSNSNSLTNIKDRLNSQINTTRSLPNFNAVDFASMSNVQGAAANNNNSNTKSSNSTNNNNNSCSNSNNDINNNGQGSVSVASFFNLYSNQQQAQKNSDSDSASSASGNAGVGLSEIPDGVSAAGNAGASASSAASSNSSSPSAIPNASSDASANASGALVKKPKKKRAPRKRLTPHQKQAHNKIEKRYRININTKIANLQQIIPWVSNEKTAFKTGGASGKNGGDNEEPVEEVPKLNKSMILEKAITYILHLQKNEEHMAKENDFLKNELKAVNPAKNYDEICSTMREQNSFSSNFSSAAGFSPSDDGSSEGASPANSNDGVSNANDNNDNDLLLNETEFLDLD